MKKYKKWTENEIKFINDNQNMLDRDVAAKLSQITGTNITQSMVRRQRRKLGVKKQRGRPKKNNTTNITQTAIIN
jgi:hypothetical protein